MAKPSTVQNVVVAHEYVDGKIKVSWDAISGLDAACVDGYNLYRDHVPYGTFATKVNTTLIDGICYIDPVYLIPNTDFYYKVTAINIDSEESDKQSEAISYFPYTAFDTSPFFDAAGQELAWQPDNLQMKYYFEEIRRRGLWMLEQDGTLIKLYKRKWVKVGEEEPYGRRGDYYSSFIIRVRIVPTGRALIMEERGMRYTFMPRSWTIWTPRLYNRDFIVTEENKRYTITNVTYNRFRGRITTQSFDLEEILPGDEGYNIND